MLTVSPGRVLTCWNSEGAKGEQRVTPSTPKYAFWDINFKLVIKKYETQKVSLTFPSYLPQGIRIEETYLKEGSVTLASHHQ